MPTPIRFAILIDHAPREGYIGEGVFGARERDSNASPQPEQYNPNPFRNRRVILMPRCRPLKGNRPSAVRRLASERPGGSEIFDLCGMDDWFRQSKMKQMGCRPSMNIRKPEPIRYPHRRFRIILFRLCRFLWCLSCPATRKVHNNQSKHKIVTNHKKTVPAEFCRDCLGL